MSIITKKPPMKETVGAQYVCFDSSVTTGEYTGAFEPDVIKDETVRSITVTESSETTPAYASGKLYNSDTNTPSAEIDVEVIAFSDETVDRMRGDTVDETTGLVLSGNGNRPFFAYGKIVRLKGDKYRFDWYPKCKLSENTDQAETSEGSPTVQTDTLKIVAYPFNANNNIKVKISNAEKEFPEGLTEDLFFSKPILSVADLTALLSSAPAETNLDEEDY